MTSITISRQFITRLMLESIPPVPFSHLMRPVDLWSQDYCQWQFVMSPSWSSNNWPFASCHHYYWPPTSLQTCAMLTLNAGTPSSSTVGRLFPLFPSWVLFSIVFLFFPLLGRNFLCLNFSLHILIVNFFCIFNIFPRLTSTSVEFIFLFPVQKRMVLSETPK